MGEFSCLPIKCTEKRTYQWQLITQYHGVYTVVTVTVTYLGCKRYHAAGKKLVIQKYGRRDVSDSGYSEILGTGGISGNWKGMQRVLIGGVLGLGGEGVQ